MAADRKRDRHKDPKRDRHKDPKRQRSGSPTPSAPPRPYDLVPIDGEGFEWPVEPHDLADGTRVETESRYCLLQALGHPALLDPAGISTQEVIRYLGRIGSDKAIVGFGLGYDFECWLKDIPDDLYLRMVNDGESVEWEGHEISLIPRKIFTVHTTAGAVYGDKARNPDTVIRRTVMDAAHYYQTSFEKALQRQGIPVPKAITEGKAKRGRFVWSDLKEVREYNFAELMTMKRLFDATKADVNEGLKEAELPFQIGPRDWYGPGALARKFLRHVRWTEEHPILDMPEEVGQALVSLPGAHSWSAPYVRRLPFSAAYKGGWVESGAIGRFAKAQDDDLHSAYPCAMARLPRWSAEDGRWTSDSAQASAWARADMVGMFLIQWSLPDDWDYYPFAYRHKHNVFFPQHGQSWVMSCELQAAIQTCGWTPEEPYIGQPAPEEDEDLQVRHRLAQTDRPGIRVLAALVLAGTEGYGSGLAEPQGDQRATATDAIQDLYVLRQDLVRQGKGSQIAIKLILNSGYGVLWRQVGIDPDQDLGLFSDLSGAWITSWTRAQIWRRIWGRHTGQQVIAIQTDGVAYLGEPIRSGIGDGLGQWESTTLTDMRQFLPGIYDHDAGVEGRKKKTRGFTSAFDPEEAWKVVEGKQLLYSYSYRFFVGRRHALAQPKKWGESRYQWREAQKVFSTRLTSKRAVRETLTEALERLRKEEQSLAKHLQQEAKARYRHLLSEIRRVTDGALIRADGTEMVRELPPAVKRRTSRWHITTVAEALGRTDSQLVDDLRAARVAAELPLSEAQRQAAEMLRGEPLPEPPRLPHWTRPKPNIAWLRDGRTSDPYDLRFRARTPYVSGEEHQAEASQMEDESEATDFVAGIGE